jgi:MFS family permease
MMRPLAYYTGEIRRLFSVVNGNARVIVVTEGLSAVPYQWYTTYLTLYMLALGVSEIQIGLLSSLLIFTQMISTFFGGYFADRFGRRWVLVVFDILCWGIPMFLYAIARNPWYFLAGRLINGFVYVVSPAMECLFVEDVPEGNRPAVFSMLQFLIAAASLLAPVAGFLVLKFGIVLAGRIIMAICMVVMVGIAVLRWFTLRETQMGQARMAVTARLPARGVAREYFQAVRLMLKDRRMRVFIGVRNLAAFATVMWGTYAVIFLADGRGIGLEKSLIAILPFVSAVVTLAMIFLAADRMRSDRIFQFLVLGQALWLVSAVLFVVSTAGTLWFAVLSTCILAISSALFTPASQSYWANIIADEQRAQVFSVNATLLALFTLPAAPLAGVLYALSPRIPFLVAIVLQGVVLWLIWGMMEKRINNQG